MKSQEVDSIQVRPGLRIGVAVAQVIDPEKLCCGLIGSSGTKFCIKGNDCTTSTHILPMRKHRTIPGLYIMDKRTGVCLINPFLDISTIDEEVINRLLITDLEPEFLLKEFALISSQDGSKDAEINAFARKNLLKTVAFKTPSKSKVQDSLFDPSSLVDIVSNFSEISDMGKLEPTVKFESVEDLNQAVSELLNYHEGLRRILPSIAGTVDSLEQKFSEKTDLIYGGIQQVRQLETTIGNQPQVLKDQNTAPTIWGSISEIFSNQKKGESDSATKLELIKGFVTQLETRLQNCALKPDTEQVKLDIFQLLKGWKVIIESVTTRVSTLESAAKIQGSGSQLDSSAFSMLGITNMNQQSSNNQSVPSTNGITSEVSDLLNVLTSRLGKLEKQHADKGKEGLNGAVRFSGVTFTNKDDVGAWLDSALTITGGIPPYGLFADPQLLLHWVWILLSGTTNSSARDMKDRISIEMSQDKTYAVDSYQHYIPLVFTGKKSSLLNTGGMDKSRLAQIPSFESWDDATGEAGLKQQIAEGLSMVRDSLSDLIEENFCDSPEVRAFALGMLHTSISFIENLGTYMSETYNNFKDVVGNEKSVWGLVTFVVEQLFRKDFGQVRAKTQ